MWLNDPIDFVSAIIQSYNIRSYVFWVIILTFPRFFSISFSVDIAACRGVIMALQKKPLIGEQVIFFT